MILFLQDEQTGYLQVYSAWNHMRMGLKYSLHTTFYDTDTPGIPNM